jgi:phenylalanyl-tRNA synthetase beta chain
MNVSLEWLQEYLPGPLTPEQAAEALTHGGLPVENIQKHGADTVIDVEVTSNRGDCLSHLGVARELTALLAREFRNVQPKAPESAAADAAALTSVRIEATDLCPHYTARVIRNVKIGPSPAWLARRLDAIGLRPINNVVDVTNYVMFETGQPLHAFDFDKLEGRRIVVRRAKQGEKLVSLDGLNRNLGPDMLVIADAARPVALAGVMGGRDTEISAATVNVLLESARFDPLSVRKTSRKLMLRSDSSYRFERGIDPTLPERASLRAAQLILETAGGELARGVASAGQSGYCPKQLTLRLAKLRQVLGIDLPPQEVMEAFTRLRLSPVLKGDRIDVTVPSYRLDLNIEVDLVEEAARVIGYDRVPVRDEIAIRVTPPEPRRRALDMVRSTLVAGGYFEAVTFGFVGDLLAGNFVPPEASPGAPLARADAAVRKADAALRPSILPGLLEAVRRNETAGTSGAKLFEIGSTFWNKPATAGGGVEERQRLGIVGAGDVREVRGVVERVLGRLDATRPVRVIPEDRLGFARGAAGRIEWGTAVVGHLGKIDRRVADKLSLRDVPAAAELDIEPLLQGAQLVPQLQPLPTFPAAPRDLSLDVAEAVRYEQVEALVRAVAPHYLEAVRHVSTYRGKSLAKGHKSVTITLVFRSSTGTLTGEQVAASVQQVVDAAKQKLGATLRA